MIRGFIEKEATLSGWKFEYCERIVLYGDTSMDGYNIFMWSSQLEEVLEYT